MHPERNLLLTRNVYFSPDEMSLFIPLLSLCLPPSSSQICIAVDAHKSALQVMALRKLTLITYDHLFNRQYIKFSSILRVNKYS